MCEIALYQTAELKSNFWISLVVEETGITNPKKVFNVSLLDIDNVIKIYTTDGWLMTDQSEEQP